METIQKDVNPSMRAILIDWLVEVSFSAIYNQKPRYQTGLTFHCN
jgi:hypothetical protein